MLKFMKKFKSDVYIYFNPSASSILYPVPHVRANITTVESARDQDFNVDFQFQMALGQSLFILFTQKRVERLNHAHKCDNLCHGGDKKPLPIFHTRQHHQLETLEA